MENKNGNLIDTKYTAFLACLLIIVSQYKTNGRNTREEAKILYRNHKFEDSKTLETMITINILSKNFLSLEEGFKLKSPNNQQQKSINFNSEKIAPGNNIVIWDFEAAISQSQPSRANGDGRQ